METKSRVLTSKTVQPEPGWLNFVATAYAKVKIETALRRRQREAIAQGEALLSERLKSQGEQLNASLLNRLTHVYRYDKPDTFLRHIGDGTFDFPEDFDRVVKGKTPKSGGNRMTRVFSSLFSNKESESQPISGTLVHRPTIDKSHPYELIEQDGLLNYQIASCCCPIPGDDVLGIIGEEGQVSVHKCSCPEATRYKTLHGDSLLSVHWAAHHTPLFETKLVIRGIDSKGATQCNHPGILRRLQGKHYRHRPQDARWSLSRHNLRQSLRHSSGRSHLPNPTAQYGYP